jgi:hypothetical protein
MEQAKAQRRKLLVTGENPQDRTHTDGIVRAIGFDQDKSDRDVSDPANR